jgi:ATP-dependent HslUV protease subunit HslV
MRRLEALLLVADERRIFVLSGTGDLIEPDDGVAAIGSGGPMALAAARALAGHSELEPAAICREALTIAAGIDVFTNTEIALEELDAWSST